MIVVIIMIELFHRPDVLFIVENTWQQKSLSAEMKKVNFNKNILKPVAVLDIKRAKQLSFTTAHSALNNAEYPIGEELVFKLVDYKDTAFSWMSP